MVLLRKGSLSIAFKVFLTCILLTLIVSAISSIIIYRSSASALFQSIRERAIAEASSAAQQIDPVLLYSIHRNSDKKSEAYLQLRNLFISVRVQNPDIRAICVARKTAKPGKWQVLFDLGNENIRVLEIDKTRVDKEMHKALTKPTANHELKTDKQGTWITGYAPIQNALGDPDAIIAVEVSARQLQITQGRLKQSAIKTAGAALLLALLLSFLVTRTTVRPINVFTQAAERVRGGDLDSQIEYKGSKETENFRVVFNHMITDLKESRDKLLEQATKDIHTGLFNHMYFQERLGAEIERAQRYNHELCLMILDVDRFKCINDNLGHPVGDCILRQLADVIQANTRKIDIVARYGGDELAIILPETSVEAGISDAERLRSCIENHTFHAVPTSEFYAGGFSPEGKKTVNVTVTIGLSGYPDHHATRDGLVMAADIALCRAKHVARNSVSAYEARYDGEDHIDPHALYQVLRDPNAAAIQSLAAAVDAKDRYTCGHSERVAGYALEIGKALGVSSESLASLNIAGLLHDLGKIGVPDSVLNKQGSLTAEERETIKRHTSVGGNILRRAPQLDVIIPAVIYHHERWDGSGYPDGLSGESIPFIARILAVADSFDAMTSDRPYRKAMSVESALLELQAGAGKQFDPNIVEAFVHCIALQNRMAA